MKRRLLTIAAVLVMMTTFSCTDDYKEVERQAEEQIVSSPSTGYDEQDEEDDEVPGACSCN